MQMNVLTGLGGTSDAPLSETIRKALRERDPLPRRIRLRTEADQNLAEALVRSLNDKNAKFAALTVAGHESVALNAALGAIEDAMSAQWRFERSLQLVPIRVSLLQLTEFADEPMQLVSAIARAIERQATNELSARLMALLPDLKADSEFQRISIQPAFDDELSDFLSTRRCGEGVRAQLDTIVRTLRAGLNLRVNRPTTEPDPYFVQELKRETAQLIAFMESHQVDSQGRIRTLESALDGVLALGIGLLVGVCLYPYVPSLAALGSGLMMGGLVTMLRLRRSQLKSQTSVPIPSVSTSRSSMPRPVRAASDTIEMGNQFSLYVDALRASGLVPVLIFEQASALGLDGHTSETWYRNLLAITPSGVGAIFVCPDETPFERVLEITHRYYIRPTVGELHRWLNQRLPLESDLSPASRARAELDRAAFRFAMISTGQGMPNLIETMLQTRQVAGRTIPSMGIQDALVMRIRATFQLAAEIIIRGHRDEMVSDPTLDALLPVALSLVISQWARGNPLKTDEASVARHIDDSRVDFRWIQLNEPIQQKLRSAVSRLVELITSRAWLVNRLPDADMRCSDLIPERALLVRAGDFWAWSFSPDGTPQFDIEAGIELTEPPQMTVPPSATMPPQLEASQITGVPAPLRQPTLEEVLEQYLGDYTPARLATVSPQIESEVTQPPVRNLIHHALMSTVETMEALDDILVGFLDGELSISELSRNGVLPTVPSPEDVRRALIEDSTPASLYILYEAGIRLRERLGIIEKIVLWVTAVKTLCQSQPSVTQVARMVAKARGLRGRTAADQHTHLPLRELKTALRELCPNIRNNAQLFQRGAAPAGDAGALHTWGTELTARSEALKRALRDGVSRETVLKKTWDCFEYRLSTHVLDGANQQPGLAEMVSYIDGYGPSYAADWLHDAPSFGQLSRIYLRDKQGDEDHKAWSCCALASIALGLNRTGYDALVGRPDLGHLGGALASRLEDAGHANRPLLLVMETDPACSTSLGAAPTGGSALLIPAHPQKFKRLKPDLVINSHVSLPNEPGEVCVAEAEDVDELMAWFRRYRS
jgi:hypothetical protein